MELEVQSALNQKGKFTGIRAIKMSGSWILIEGILFGLLILLASNMIASPRFGV